jgi:hypothetical protein
LAVAIDHDDKLDPRTRSHVRQFAVLKEQQRVVSEEMAAVKAALSDIVAEQGEVDEDGHKVLDFGREIGKYRGLQYQRRVIRHLDEEAALEVLIGKHLEDRCIRHVPEIDQDEVMACVAEGLLTDEDVDQMYPAQISWALCTIKA